MKAIDLFSGCGGFSVAAQQAGVSVLLAANHWPAAVHIHSRNHPKVEHWTQDLQQADFSQCPAHDLLLASPSCVGHTPARGKDRPRHDTARSTAWAVLTSCEVQRPRAFIVENVKEYLEWDLFPAWKIGMEALGYKLSWSVLDSQHFDLPQMRDRIFIVGMQKKAFRFPERRPSPQVPVSKVLRLDEGAWSPLDDAARSRIPGKKPFVERTKSCIEAGLAQFGRKGFWIPYHGSNWNAAYSLDRPIWSIATNDGIALVKDGRWFRFLLVSEIRDAMGFPADYILHPRKKDAKMMLGNAVCPPVARWLISEVMKAA